MRLHELQEKRASLVTQMRGLVEAAEKESRDLADGERARFDAIKGDLSGLETRIQRAAAVQEFERLADAQPIAGDRSGAPDLSAYSVAKAVRAMDGARLDGIEAEFHQELSRGREARGIMIPTQVFLGEARSQTAGTDTKGGLLVETKIAPLADRFRPQLKTESMGATVLRTLTGNLDLPSLASSGTAYWVNEDGAPTRTDVTFEKSNMTPKTVSAEYQMSRRLQLQANESVENILRKDIGFLLAQKLDSAAINGPGTPTEPCGILNAGIEKVATSSDFTDTTADLIAALELDDVNGTRAFLSNPHVGSVARKLKNGNGDPMPYSVAFHGERVEFTTQVPTNVGSGSNKSALIFGQWGELVIGYWSGVDILSNPYHSDVASKGGLLLHAFLDADVLVRHPVAFAWAEIA